MHSVVISDTSTLILLHKINEFELLKEVYGKLMTTPEIADEFGEKLPDWITMQSVKDENIKNFWKLKLIVAKQVLWPYLLNLKTFYFC